MYIYVGFFNDDEIRRKSKFISKEKIETIKSVFNDFSNFNELEIDGAIGYFLGKNNQDKPSFIMDIKAIRESEENTTIEFDINMELDISSGRIGKEIYKTARKMGWVDKKTGYTPLLLIMNKQDFDSIRKGSPNVKKLSNTMAKAHELRTKNDWEGICQLYSPLEEIANNIDLWNNADELYGVGFACSKLGEPENGKERNATHLKYVEEHRELAIKLYKRCYELEPYDFKYSSALAYRHYQNVNELSKPKGRRDGISKEEIGEAHKWFDIALEIYPNNIKNNYRKGKLIIDKQLKNLRYSGKVLDRESFKEIELLTERAINCLEKVILIYEGIVDENKKRNFRNEYIKSLYTLGKFYCDEIEIYWNDFLCSKISNTAFICNFYNLDNLVKSKELIEKCFQVVTNISVNEKIDLIKLSKISKDSIISPIDIFNSLGNIYFKMYYVKLIKNSEEGLIEYKKLAEDYFLNAINLRKEFYKQKIPFRSISYIKAGLGKLYILSGSYADAIKITKGIKDGYIVNTYAAALILTGEIENINEANNLLEDAVKDKYNLAKPLSLALLAKTHELTENYEKLSKLLNEANKEANKSTEKLFKSILQVKI